MVRLKFYLGFIIMLLCNVFYLWSWGLVVFILYDPNSNVEGSRINTEDEDQWELIT